MSDEQLYPTLTCEVGTTTTSATAGASTSTSGGSLGTMARNAIRAALGWQYRGGDATANLRTFEAALGKAFRLKDVDGHVEAEWVPQGFSIQADLGEITGAQASICRQAQALLEQTLPLLDKLEPLGAAADEDDIDSMRAIIRSELNEIVTELGQPGGPRVQKIDHYFWLLLGATIDDEGEADVCYDPRGTEEADADEFAGHLRKLRDRLSMTEQRINTVEEEVKFTDFLLLVDNVASLHRTWVDKRSAFVTGGRLFFGTLLSRLARQMEVIAESVQDVGRVLDSVYIGAAERQVIELGTEDLVVVEAPDGTSARILGTGDLAQLAVWAASADVRKWTAHTALATVVAKISPAKRAVADAALETLGGLVDSGGEPEAGAYGNACSALVSLCSVWGDELFAELANKTTVPACTGGAVEVIGVGAGVDSITLDGLLTWIETFVTVEGRHLINEGGKDGTATFASTMQRFTDFVYSLLLHVADFGGQIAEEREEKVVNTELYYYPGCHSARVYRALRQLFTHLQATAQLAGSDGACYLAPVYVTTDDEPGVPPAPLPRPRVPIPASLLPAAPNLAPSGNIQRVATVRDDEDLVAKLYKTIDQLEAEKTALQESVAGLGDRLTKVTTRLASLEKLKFPVAARTKKQ